MKRQRLFIAATLLVAGWAQAGELTPELFVRADLEARQATLTGMQEQINLLSAKKTATEVQKRVDANRAQISSIYSFYGTTPTAHAAYGTQYRAYIEGWLRAHPEWQTVYGQSTQDFQRLAAQLDGLRGKK